MGDIKRLRRIIKLTALIVWACVLSLIDVHPIAAAPSDPVAVEINRLLAVSPVMVRDVTLSSPFLLRAYQARHDKPLWDGNVAPLLAVLSSAEEDGLPTDALHLDSILTLHAETTPAARAAVDVLLTDAVITYARMMRGQRVHPQDFEKDWRLPQRGFDLDGFWRSNSGSSEAMAAALRGLAPTDPAYAKLRNQLVKIKAWAALPPPPQIPTGPTLHPGERDPRVVLLRQRLAQEPGLTASAQGDDLFDEAVAEPLKLFQQRHGLLEDGALGMRTVAALNVTPAERVRQIRLTLERWRWLAPPPTSDYIWVNLPAQEFELHQAGQITLRMRVIIGDPEHPTPPLRSAIDMLVLNPTWTVPSSIATKEILPRLQRRADYLAKNDLEIIGAGFAPEAPERQGSNIDWKSMTSFPWSLRQKPGSDNALGAIKFSFPNQDDIYLHDTPNHKLFARASRALSHGCVRLDRPRDLALTLLAPQGWTAERLEKELAKGTTQDVSLSKTMPVWLVYFTVWEDDDGVLQWRDDVHGRDRRLLEALSAAAHPVTVAAMPAAPAGEIGAPVTAR